MRFAVLVAVLVALPSLAVARPITAGVGLGRIQSKVNAEGSADTTLQLFARMGFTKRLGAQLEIQRIQPDETDANIRTFTALLVVELSSHPRFVPLLVAGFGIDRASYPYGYESNGTHTEGGLGLEYRAQGGLTIGFDVRLGGRSVEDEYKIQPLLEDDGSLYAPSTLQEGEYRSARLTVGVRF